jgi:4-hydroxy-tetrahydrodipicolinate reductase
MSLKLAIAGAAGRMGQSLIRAAVQHRDLEVVGGTERPGASIGQDLGLIAGLAPLGPLAATDPKEAASGADVWLDFTAPVATVAALQALEDAGVRAAILGTTGLDDDQEAAISRAASRLAIVRSGNFSMGVNLLAALVEQAAARLGAGWDIEIFEAHHRRKIDAPSGTALLLGEAAARGRGVPLKDVRLAAREGITGPRKDGAIGFASVRGGGLVGDHHALFAAERETVTLSHSALDRSVFADGAIEAARWAADKPPGLYSMRDVLGL